MIFLDTSILSIALRRRPGSAQPELVEWFRGLLARERLVVPGIVMQEILSGVRDPGMVERLRARLTVFPLLLAEAEDHLLAASFRNVCQAKGVAASTPDCLIAAQAARQGAELLAVDGDYIHMAKHCPGLRLRALLT